jgi:hypothetical protein
MTELTNPFFRVFFAYAPEITCITPFLHRRDSRDNAVGIATGYGLDGRGVRSSSPGKGEFFNCEVPRYRIFPYSYKLSLIGPNNLMSIPFSNTPNLCKGKGKVVPILN